VSTPPPASRLPRGLVALLALFCGAAVANLYYAQPLLSRIAAAFHVSDATAGLLVSAGQLGYLAGLALLVPAGDLLERRRLIAVVTVLAGAAAAACAAAPGFPILAAATVVLGVMSVVAQIIVALVSTLAAPQERGRVVGTVMSGLLVGILLARTLSGVIAQLGGWRLVFIIAAATMVGLAAVLARALPHAPPTERVSYRSALRSVLSLVAAEPVLRARMLLGALGFGSFSVLWTSLAFLLSGAPYHYGEAIIGLFGLAGAAGACAAPLAGRLADRGRGRLGMSAFLICLAASWALLALGRTSLAALLGGIVVLDLGVQGAHISNQTVIYGLHAQARSRLTTAYMVSNFSGGLIGSVLSATLWGAGGWPAVCLLGAGMSLAALALWTVLSRVPALGPRRVALSAGAER
jgi:predicted MFS family arabinose efflux permease